MRILWTLFKIIIGLAIAIPLAIVALGVVGVVLALAILALKLAVVGLIGYGLYRVVRHLVAPSSPARRPVASLPAPDPYYEAAMRELDREMGRAPGR
ncbi:MAG: hypothetical protein ABJA80_06745 [bacterium]